MKIAYFDCFSGISGDMILGALVDAGVPIETLSEELSNLNLSNFELKSSKVKRGFIWGTKVDVITGHEHAHRKLDDIIKIIDASSIPEKSKEYSKKIFIRLAQAEGKVHGRSPEEIHFHEVGALDAIVDIVGAVLCLELLGIEKVYASPLRLGKGVIHAAHGVIPIPAPATVELTIGVPVERTDIEAELVTPTGAAILTTLASGFGKAPVFTPTSVGYGAGTRDLQELPNMLRVQVGESVPILQQDHTIVIETNIDDMNPEIYGYIIDKLLAEGAKEAYLTPVFMKKGRPATLLTVLVDADTVEKIIRTIFRETTTLGVRFWTTDRRMLERSSGVVETEFGTIRTKIAEFDGTVRERPEYEDCARIAKERDLPILEVYRAAAKRIIK